MVRYAETNSHLWQIPTFKKFSPLAQRFYIYLTSCPSSNCIGLFHLEPGYAMTDLTCSDGEFHQWMKEVCETGWVRWDDANNIVLLAQYICEKGITSQAHFKSAVKQIKCLPETALLEDLARVVHTIPGYRLSSPGGFKLKGTRGLLAVLPTAHLDIPKEDMERNLEIYREIHKESSRQSSQEPPVPDTASFKGRGSASVPDLKDITKHPNTGEAVDPDTGDIQF